jgi:transcriptional regulator with AAA-type ATPase domain
MYSFRSISLCDGVSHRACFDTGYRFASRKAENMTVVLELEMSVSFWRRSHEMAIAREWEAEVDRALELESEGREPLRARLIAQGPGVVRDTAVNESGVIADRLSLLLPRLRPKARRIADRRTVFLLPEDEVELGPLAKRSGLSTEALIEALSEQLFQLLENDQAEDFTFVRVGAALDGNSVLEKMVEHVHSRLAADILDHKTIVRDGPVLFVGPTGTGKTYGAKLLSKKMDKKPFVPVNLSAITGTTLESRIRGYQRGAFTGANPQGSPSWFEQANGGVLFLDEFQSVPLEYQTQLLDLLNAVSDRVKVARMGSDDKYEFFQVKVVLAVNEDLNELLHSGRLRRDLFYRMRHLVHFPTLRKRFSGDTPALRLRILMKTYRWRLAPLITCLTLPPQSMSMDGAYDDLPKSRLRSMFPVLASDAEARMLGHSWPGNLRELERVASDLFCECDDNDEPAISRAQVEAAIRGFSIPEPDLSPHVDGPLGVPRHSSSLLHEVEEALRANGFVIVHTLALLKKTHPMHNLRSHKSLRSFLNENAAQLSTDIRDNRKVRRFMQTSDRVDEGEASGRG